MSVAVFLHGALASHRRATILEEALGAVPGAPLPEGQAAVLAFADEFQAAEVAEQARLIEWTRASGHLLLLLPPFAAAACDRPVSWRVERVESAPRGGEGLARILAPEVAYRLTGKLQTPALPGATWSDLSVSVGCYRPHPAAGLFAVTCLPLWSLAVLDAPTELETWFTSLVSLAGESLPVIVPSEAPLSPDHYGLLVFLLSRTFADHEDALVALRSSSVFRFSADRGRALLKDLCDRGLVDDALPTNEAYELVMQSPYAHYVSAIREVSQL